MELSTPRLILRPHTPEDFNDYYNYIMDENLQYMLGLHDVTDRPSAKLTFDWLRANTEFLALIPKDTGATMGHICIHPANAVPGKKGVDLTFAISAALRRQGLMEEALRCVIYTLFAENRADYIQCEYTSFNEASKNLQEKLGFRLLKSEPLEDFTLFTCILEPSNQ